MKKGFTLIEVIAVIFILGILSSIAGVTYTTISNNHKKKSCENLKMQIENAAIEYVQDGHISLPTPNILPCCEDNYCACVEYNNSQPNKKKTLIYDGYLEAGLKNPIDDKTLEKVTIRVEYDKVKDIYKANIIEDFCNK